MALRGGGGTQEGRQKRGTLYLNFADQSTRAATEVEVYPSQTKHKSSKNIQKRAGG